MVEQIPQQKQHWFGSRESQFAALVEITAPNVVEVLHGHCTSCRHPAIDEIYRNMK